MKMLRTEKEHPSLTYIKQQVAEINTLEQAHTYAECRRYAPGRCPICYRLVALEREHIDMEVAIIEEDVLYSLQHQKASVEDAMRLLAQADVYRCHARGKWPRSIAEIEDAHLVAMSLRRRLNENFSADEHDSDFYEAIQRRGELIETQYVPAYQRIYREACLERWELQQFEHYSPATTQE